MRAYQVYGLRVKSVIPLPCPPISPGLVEVEVVHGSPSLFSRVYQAISLQPDGTRWFQQARLPDGSRYLRWSGLFEFLIARDGRKIFCRSLDGTAPEAFQTYLLGQVLSFALLKLGVESLHSTAVIIDGGVVGFVGDCGYGKSSLGAAFLQADYPVLTDDLLVVKEEDQGYYAYPGLPRIKLFPKIAQSLLGERVRGTPMNNLTSKLIISLGRHQSHRASAPLTAIYVLMPPSAGAQCEKVTIRRLSQRRAFLELLKSTFNPVIIEAERLKRQFILATRLASKVPIKLLSYPRTLALLPSVRETILSDLPR